MVRNNSVICVFVLVLLIVAEGSDASFFSEIRRIMAVAPEINGTKISPSPAPIPETKSEKNLDLNNTSSTEKPEKLKPGKHVDLNNTSTEKPDKLPVPEKEKVSQVEQKGLNGTVPEVAKNETQINKELNQEVVNEKCEPSANKCTVQEKMIACLKHSNNGSPNFIILIQNEGESILNVSVRVSASVEVSLKELQIREHQAKKINASINTRESHKIVLNSGYGDCVLYTGVPVSEGNFFQRIPYANQVTPIYGAYFMFLVALIVGGTWGCCKLRKKGQRGNGGVPYQELEMALPESATAVDVDAENGWDQGWDDDWDEDRTAKSLGNHVGNLSANGLTSRSTNRDGWENDWDD
ncbi:transmembrane protein [Thalictrum thalictroides]|uniref:Transmembrane protein n=1 Tax=Thalictrum thalictroides TaxID=46969 RepID=A0A7J6VWA6_THATH|nr:transmembrane protein [Thalictrum thalictroides]